ncbi:MAG: hypothetical protein KF700_06880 [Hyphomonadaceae bacterium]|nr:hypothetical protein [Hyphomonadaceae bacterium]
MLRLLSASFVLLAWTTVAGAQVPQADPSGVCNHFRTQWGELLISGSTDRLRAFLATVPPACRDLRSQIRRFIDQRTLVQQQEQAAREQAARELESRDQAAREAREQAARAEQLREEAARSTPYNLALLHPQVRTAVEQARAHEPRARRAAAQARDAAARAEAAAARARAGEGGHAVRHQENGDRYEGVYLDGRRADVGIYYYRPGVTQERFAGEFRNNFPGGFGVSTYRPGPANSSHALRIEGEWAESRSEGFGMTYWNGGNVFIGERRASLTSHGVMNYWDGGRFEGQFVGYQITGYGARWDPQGRVIDQGIYANGMLITPLAP